MKVPKGLLDTRGSAGKGEVLLVAANDADLKEFGNVTEGNTTSCYVLTSVNDLITVRFAFNPGVADLIDLVVDGVLRNSVSNRRPQTLLRGTINRVFDQPKIGNGGRRSGVKYCQMLVKSRSTENDIPLEGDKCSSAVGSLRVQIFQKTVIPTDTPTDSADKPSQSMGIAGRAPGFDKYASWLDVPDNHNINFNEPAPPFEIGFIDDKKPGKATKDKVLKEYPGEYKLWATFIFHLRSAAVLKILGFQDVPTYYSPPTPIIRKKLAITKVTKPRKPNDDLSVAMVPAQSNEAADEMQGVIIQDQDLAVETYDAKVANIHETERVNFDEKLASLAPSSSSTLSLPSSSRRVVYEATEATEATPNTEYQVLTASLEGDNNGLQIKLKEKPDMVLEASPNKISKEIAPLEEQLQEPSTTTLGMFIQSSGGNITYHKIAPNLKFDMPNKIPSKILPKKTGWVLSGMKAAPAHHAWLERGSTQETEDWPLILSDHEFSQTQSQDINFRTIDDKSHPIEALTEPQTPIEKTLSPTQQIQTSTSVNFEQPECDTSTAKANSPDWEPMTPPPSTLKPHISQSELVNDNRFVFAELERDGVIRETKPLANVFQNNLGMDLKTITEVQSLEKSGIETLSQAPALTTTRSELSMAETSNVTKPEEVITIAAENLEDQSAVYTGSKVLPVEKAISVVSDIPTEVVDPEHIEESLRNSWLTKSLSLQKSSIIGPSPRIQSPELGSSFRLIRLRAKNPMNLGIPEHQRAPRPQGETLQSSTPRQTFPTLPTQNVEVSQLIQSQNSAGEFTRCWVYEQHRQYSPTPALQPQVQGSQVISTEKRKADLISGNDTTLRPNPKKSTIDPASRSIADIEKKRAALQARIAAAKLEQRVLDEEENCVLLLEQAQERLKEDTRLVEQMERGNAERRTIINARCATVSNCLDIA